jgi:hypothetical protein
MADHGGNAAYFLGGWLAALFVGLYLGAHGYFGLVVPAVGFGVLVSVLVAHRR